MDTTETLPSGVEIPPDQLLADHHRELDRMFGALVTRARGGDTFQLRQAWDAFERGLLGHLELEEREILPGFARDDAGGAKAILDEHAAIRTALLELGVNLDLHLLRADVVEAFVEQLRAHARREEAALYPWATRHVLRREWSTMGRALREGGGARGR
jgi:hemerythrin-like domain-containing protein